MLFPLAPRVTVKGIALLLGTALVALGGPNMSLASTQTHSSSRSIGPTSYDSPITQSADSFGSTPSAKFAYPDKVESDSKLAANRPGAYLINVSQAAAKPHLQIAYYNSSDGLLAGYQAYSGKRILIRAIWMSNGGVNAEVAHFDPKSNRVVVVIGTRRQTDAPANPRSRPYEVAGVPILSHLRAVSLNSYSNHQHADTLATFVRSDAGQAITEAIPVLYAALESMEDDAGKLALLQAPLGGVLTALQLSTNTFTAFEQSASVLGTARANSLRSACQNDECLYRGRHFTIQSNGLFDVLSKSGSSNGKKLARNYVPTLQSSPLQVLRDLRKNGNGICNDPGEDFGYCGPGAVHPGDIQTPACFQHDMCVCRYSWGQCFVNTPDECGADCASLIVAIWSYIEAIFGGGRPKSPEDPDRGPGEEIPDWWTT